MADEPKLELGPAIAFFACAVGAVVEGARIALGHTDDLRILWVRGVIVMGCFVWAVCYGAAMEEPRYKKLLGVLAIIVSAALLWYQLTKLGEAGWDKAGAVDRCTFLLGGIALLSKGMKDAFGLLRGFSHSLSTASCQIEGSG